VERKTVLAAPPDAVWESLPALVGDDDLAAEPGAPLRATGPEGERIGVVDDADAPRRLAFWWTAVDGDDVPSFVEIDLEPVELTNGVGTILHVRESRFDAPGVLNALLQGPLAHARG